MGDQRRNESVMIVRGGHFPAESRLTSEHQQVKCGGTGDGPATGAKPASPDGDARAQGCEESNLFKKGGALQEARLVGPAESRDWEGDGTPQIASFLGRCEAAQQDESTEAPMLHVKSLLCFRSPAALQALDLTCAGCCCTTWTAWISAVALHQPSTNPPLTLSRLSNPRIIKRWPVETPCSEPGQSLGRHSTLPKQNAHRRLSPQDGLRGYAQRAHYGHQSQPPLFSAELARLNDARSLLGSEEETLQHRMNCTESAPTLPHLSALIFASTKHLDSNRGEVSAPRSPAADSIEQRPSLEPRLNRRLFAHSLYRQSAVECDPLDLKYLYDLRVRRTSRPTPPNYPKDHHRRTNLTIGPLSPQLHDQSFELDFHDIVGVWTSRTSFVNNNIHIPVNVLAYTLTDSLSDLVDVEPQRMYS
ncbi:hypothetical protein N431DRAFT_453991 [Stipitochalara longipes BDJ]|nr:hypothetical protein N431DRAFT_453991 [Stipitochalara longipes BDJ]